MAPAADGDDWLAVTAYFGERKRANNRPVADVLLDLCARNEIAAAVVLRGVEGFGLRHHLRTDSSLTLSEDLPAVVVVLDRRDRIAATLDAMTATAGCGLITVERARLVTADASAAPTDIPSSAEGKLTVYLGRRDRIAGEPAYKAACRILQQHGAAAASVNLGVDGVRHGRRTRAAFIGRNRDIPLMITAIGRTTDLLRAAAEVNTAIEPWLVTLERVDICVKDGQALRNPPSVAASDEHGLARWQKLTVYADEAQLAGRQPVYRALTAGLRAAGAAGLTNLRGIWGFCGAQAPHGDRFLQIGRAVPSASICVDTPERVAEIFPLVAEVAGPQSMVVSEVVPAMRSATTTEARGGLQLARRLSR